MATQKFGKEYNTNKPVVANLDVNICLNDQILTKIFHRLPKYPIVIEKFAKSIDPNIINYENWKVVAEKVYHEFELM